MSDRQHAGRFGLVRVIFFITDMNLIHMHRLFKDEYSLYSVFVVCPAIFFPLFVMFQR